MNPEPENPTPPEQAAPAPATESAKAKAKKVKEKVEAMKARQAEIPATPEEAIPPHTIEDMPADTETGEIFNEPEEQ